MVFYVYAHLRKTDMSVFYIGKGSGNRAFVKSGRNKMWEGVYKKHGCLVVILNRFNSEKEAFEEEERLINKIGIENLTNMTKGGKGAPGVEFSESRKRLAREHLNVVGKPHRDMAYIMKNKNKKRIFTKCGRSFLGAAAAKKWMELQGVCSPQTHAINRAARYGGSHKGIFLRYKEVKFVEKRKTVAKKVGNSDGEIFDSILDASKAMATRGKKCGSSSIHNAINGKTITAAGKRWGYVVDGEIVIKEFERKTKLKKIRRSDGMIFESLKAAADFMEKGSNANKNISLAARGKTKTAYGYEWEYL